MTPFHFSPTGTSLPSVSDETLRDPDVEVTFSGIGPFVIGMGPSELALGTRLVKAESLGGERGDSLTSMSSSSNSSSGPILQSYNAYLS